MQPALFYCRFFVDLQLENASAAKCLGASILLATSTTKNNNKANLLTTTQIRYILNEMKIKCLFYNGISNQIHSNKFAMEMENGIWSEMDDSVCFHRMICSKCAWPRYRKLRTINEQLNKNTILNLLNFVKMYESRQLFQHGPIDEWILIRTYYTIINKYYWHKKMYATFMLTKIFYVRGVHVCSIKARSDFKFSIRHKYASFDQVSETEFFKNYHFEQTGINWQWRLHLFFPTFLIFSNLKIEHRSGNKRKNFSFRTPLKIYYTHSFPLCWWKFFLSNILITIKKDYDDRR